MACGKPVIASNSSAIPEVVEDGVTGILCPTGDIEAFATACRYMAAHPEVAQRYGNAGRQRALAIFSEEVIVPQYIALYERLAGDHG
jgi:glycosyltransferase involved in cell wall biosynthesis